MQINEQWLIARERAYGGKQTGIRRRKVSPLDQRTRSQLAKGGMQGGDRYFDHGYAPAYAEAFARFDREDRLVIVELGILRGSGLAVLCDAFPHSRVIGLEVDLSHWREHGPQLRKLGAFRDNEPEIHEFDELALDADRRFVEILGDDQDRGFDIFIDDALHDDVSILNTFAWASPHIGRGGRYFIEDNSSARDKIPGRFGEIFDIASFGRLTVIRWRQS